MKRIIILLGILVGFTAVYDASAQDKKTEGIIIYEMKIDQHRRLSENMKSMVPQFRIEKEQLTFKDGESLYKKLEEDTEEQMAVNGTGNTGGNGMHVIMMNPKIEIYTDLRNQTQLSAQNLMGKDYLVSDSIRISPWKFGTETKTILGYECKQAYYTDESRPNNKQEITAWYTDKAILFLGPDRYQSLPGTVLAVDVNNGERTIVAQSIAFRPLKKNELQKPTDGTKVTKAEFRAIAEEQMKKMGGGNGSFIKTND